jgi:hypothetical protein
MKKTLLFFAMLATFVCVQAQTTLPNGDFELWSYGKPVGWTPGLYGNLTVSSYVNLPVEVSFCTETNDAHSGSKAVRITSGEVTIPYVGYSFVIPGFLQVGEAESFSLPLQNVIELIQMLQDTTSIFVIDSSTLESLTPFMKVLSPGIPCPSTPRYVTLWAKYQPQEIDTMMVLALMKKDGEFVDIAYKQFYSIDSNNYEQIAVEFENPGAQSDSIMIFVFSSTRLNSTSVLFVDDIELSNGVSVPLLDSKTDKIYPNPVSDVLFLQPGSEEPYHWVLRDLTGRTLQSGTATGKTSIDVKRYPSGVYMLTLNINGQESTRKVIVR